MSNQLSCQKCGERIRGGAYQWGEYRVALCGLCYDDLESEQGRDEFNPSRKLSAIEKDAAQSFTP
jgi:hypothetical protein